MAFDFSTAKPARNKSSTGGKFDFSSVQPQTVTGPSETDQQALPPQTMAGRVLNLLKSIASSTTMAPARVLTNPVAARLEQAGEKVSSVAGDIGHRLAMSSGRSDTAMPAARLVGGSAIEAAADIGKLTPQNLALNVGGEAVGRVALPVISKVAGGVGKKGLSYMTGVSEDAINAALKRPQVLEASMEGVAREMPGVAGKYDQAVKHISDVAKEKLSTSRYIEKTGTDLGGAFTRDEVTSAVTQARRKLGGVYTPESETAAKVLNKIKGNLGKVRNTVSQNQVHDLITDLDAEIPWDKAWSVTQDFTATDHALIDARTSLDALLKKRNPEYAKEIAKVENLITGRNAFLRETGLIRIKGEGFGAGNITATKLKGALNENKIEMARVLGKTKELTGEDIVPRIESAAHGEEFRRAGSVGKFAAVGMGKFSAAGMGAGGSVGGFPGAAVGALAGGALDKNAPKIMGDLIRLSVKGKPILVPLKYVPYSIGLRAIPRVTSYSESK